MTKSTHNSHLNGIAQVLVLEQLIDNEQAHHASLKAKQKHISFVQYLVEEKLISPSDIAQASARGFGVPLVDLDALDRELFPLDLVSDDLIREHQALPVFRRGDHLFVAVADPSRQHAFNEIKFHTGLTVHSLVVELDKLNHHIDHALSLKEAESLDEFLDSSELDDVDIDASDLNDTDTDNDNTEDAPVVRFVHKILLDAVHRAASDIHFEPYENEYRVRFRVDGILYEIATPPVNLANRIAARLKVMSRLDISERRIPQDGRFKMNLSKHHSIDFRVSTCPTVNGEKIVMRILDQSGVNLGIDALGFSEQQKQHFLKAIAEPQGMILVTGPTGSGKTVSLYTALSMLNTEEKNISTAEDPVEIKLTGVNQVNINLKTGLTFAGTLRSFLRQDPDIIMVGEMRDLETAEIGIKASQTGHLVLSTLHTNSASETLTRLVNMGVPPFNIASSVSLIIAQRLARKLCPKCKQPLEFDIELLRNMGFTEEELETKPVVYQPIGCEDCTQGYKGRVGLFEVLPMSKALGEIILNGGNARNISERAQQDGMLTIRRDGLDKVLQGITSLEEVNRVTKD